MKVTHAVHQRVRTSVLSATCAGSLGALAFLLAPSFVGAPIDVQAAAATPRDVEATGIWGRYRHAGGDGEQARLRAAIHRATEDMAPGIRGIARSRLEASLKPYPTLSLAQSGRSVTIEKGTEPKIEVDPSGPAQWTSGNGDRFTVRVRTSTGTLVEMLKNDRTSSRVVYQMHSDQKLRVTTTIQDTRLPGTIQYTLVYAHE